MPEIVVDNEQAKVILEATEEVLLRDRDGNLLGRITPVLSDEEARIVVEARRRLSSNQPRFTTAEVLDHLNSLESK